jgi:AMMECR1 domain-containing protein
MVVRRATNMAIKMEIRYPKWLKTLMSEKLPTNEARKAVVRPAVRSAMRPIAAQLRVEARNVAKKSKRKQGTGATSRAVIIKVATHKKNKGVVYGIVGINRRWYEVMHNTKGSKRGKFMTYAKQANFKRDLRTKRTTIGALKRLKKTTEVNSYYRASFSMNKRRFSPVIKRMPVKYFHLIEMGFRHWRGGNQTVAYHILRRSFNSNKTRCQKLLEQGLVKNAVNWFKRKGIPLTPR